MVDADRRPTAQEIEELIDLVRRDPSSPAFIDLGEAYLNLGRPKDAIKIGTMGVEASPDSLEGRVMLARAHAQLHQWKEAQGELLRVVKVDRSNRAGFALLGEVLLRRADFERAVPVLQHAQNLDPTSPSILAMLKRARNKETLDPPAPVPSPVPPRGETSYGQPAAPPAAPRARPMPPSAPPPMRSANPSVPPPIVAPTPAAPPVLPKASAPIPIDPSVRPRVLSTTKPANAAAASLRQSAAVGETYLNELLTGGLLDVAGVRVPDSDFDLRPDRRWGRSTRRAFIFLFVVLVLGIGGGGTWYWWSEKKKGEAIARYRKEAEQAIALGEFSGFKTAEDKLREALKLDDKDVLTFAYAAESAGLRTLLYGTHLDGPDQAADQAITRASKDINKPEQDGMRQLLIGRAALQLERLHTLDEKVAKEKLAALSKDLDAWLAKHDDDRWVRWLKGRAQLAAGERKDGRATIARAATGDDGLVVALIDQGDLFVDDGHLDKALQSYTDALKRAKDHPLAILGRAIGRAETGVDVEAALNELNDKFIDKQTPARVTAYRALGRALGNLATDEYREAANQLRAAVDAANGPHPVDMKNLTLGDERFWTRVGWIYYLQGRLNDANDSVKYLHDYSAHGGEDYPPLKLLVAANSLANGNAERALDIATKIEGVRAKLIRAQAYLDLGQYAEAQKEAEELKTLAADNNDAAVLREEARMLGNAKERTDAANALVALSRKLKTKLPLHALGYAYLTLGDLPNAKEALTKALADVSDESPNPAAYRTETALAQIALASNDLPEAGKHLDAAIALDKNYFSARALQAKLVLKNEEPERALKFVDALIKDTNNLTGVGSGAYDVQLTQAEALVTKKGATAADKDKAKQLLVAIKDKIQPPTEVGRVAAMIDPKLPEELGVPVPVAAPVPGAPPSKPPKKTPKRR